MYVARVLYPVEVLGPGKRVGIWFCGCPHRCKGCSNPELWDFQARYKTTPETVYEIIKSVSLNHTIDGFTITGGDPFYQADNLVELLDLLKEISDDIIVYTGYNREEIKPDDLKNISVLIDGEYIEELNDNSLLKGSSNQQVHILDDNKAEKYKIYFNTESNKVQNFFTADGVVSVGIHRPDF
jgi:anaerobic ribonucleoside-triphosphate reductase activating protein